MFLWGKAISDGKSYYCRKGKKSSGLFYGKNDISICRTETMVQRASGIGGAIIGFGGVKQYSAGTNGIFGWLQVINPQTGFDSTVVAAIIACIASFVSAVLLMKIFDKKLGIDHI